MREVVKKEYWSGWMLESSTQLQIVYGLVLSSMYQRKEDYSCSQLDRVNINKNSYRLESMHGPYES